jgi:hypothetical protein
VAKIIQILDSYPEGLRVRLDDGSYNTLDHNACPSIGDEVPIANAKRGMVEPRLNLTDKQWELLEALVSGDESNHGAEFHFACNVDGCGITYPGGISLPGVYNQTDLVQLGEEHLVTLIGLAGNLLRGKPTQDGIIAVRRRLLSAPAHLLQAAALSPEAKAAPNSPPDGAVHPQSEAKRLMKDYEDRLPLLGYKTRERLQQRGAVRELQLRSKIEGCEQHFRARTHELVGVEDEPFRKAAEIAFLEECRILRAEIVSMAAGIAADTVRDFADAFLLSQPNLALDVVLLRDYTGRLIREVRHWVNASELFAIDAPIPWSDDPIAQRAIRACEETIDLKGATERQKVMGQPDQIADAQRAWSPIVLEWETLKAPPKNPLGGPERIPESEIRSILAEQIGIKPEDITEVQIEHAALELCNHYESFQMLPAATNDLALPDFRRLCETARPDSTFWKELEDEFREHNVGQNALLGALWLTIDQWAFHIGGKTEGPTAEVLRIFKSLAREAGKGLGSKRGPKAWIDWLELLSCAQDDDTGKLHYSPMSGSSYVDECEFERMVLAGEEIPPGLLVEFRLRSDGTLRKGRRWFHRSARIENLLKKSADQCLELRSLVPTLWTAQPEEKSETVTTVDTTGKTSTHPAVIVQIRASLDAGDRKTAVALRLGADECTVKELFMSAFVSLGGTESTKRTAYNRWRASRGNAPSWADELMKARLLR